MATMRRRDRDAEAELNLPPGFRFHPTDEELVVHYLCRKVSDQFLPVSLIAEVDLYKFDPWVLPEMALFGNKEWYFFTPRDRKYPNGSRPNRAAGTGYWKATGADKPVTPKGCSRPVGIKKALVFYAGKAPKGIKTDWIMHEYRLADSDRTANGKRGNLRLDNWVLCRLYNKKNNWEKETHQLPKTEMIWSLGEESMDSFEEVASFAERTPESDIDNEVYITIDEHQQHLSPIDDSSAIRSNTATAAHTTIGGEMQRRIKEDDDWFTELNLDDFQNPFTAFTTAPPNVDLSGDNQDYYCNNYFFSGLSSPLLQRIPSQPSLVQF